MILIISQIIGLMAVGLYLLSYQLKKRKQKNPTRSNMTTPGKTGVNFVDKTHKQV